MKKQHSLPTWDEFTQQQLDKSWRVEQVERICETRKDFPDINDKYTNEDLKRIALESTRIIIPTADICTVSVRDYLGAPIAQNVGIYTITANNSPSLFEDLVTKVNDGLISGFPLERWSPLTIREQDGEQSVYLGAGMNIILSPENVISEYLQDEHFLCLWRNFGMQRPFLMGGESTLYLGSDSSALDKLMPVTDYLQGEGVPFVFAGGKTGPNPGFAIHEPE